MADSSYGPKVYHKQGGDELVVASGGAITVETGGTITVGGVDLIGELAALDGLDVTELGYINGVTAGTVLAGKAVVTTTDKHIDALVISDGGLALGAGAGTAVTATAAQLNRTAVTTAGVAEASKAAVLGANKNLDEFHTAALYLGAGAGTLVASTAAQIDAAVAGTPLIYRTSLTAAQVNAGVTAVVPAVAGKQFQVLGISMRATGGAVSGPTTVEVVEETAGTVFLSHVTADLTQDTWHNLVTGTPVITGMTAGGMTGVANKALIVTKTGGTDFATATGLDVIVSGYYTS